MPKLFLASVCFISSLQLSVMEILSLLKLFKVSLLLEKGGGLGVSAFASSHTYMYNLNFP